jgi:polyhydroxyalkanoate synthase
VFRSKLFELIHYTATTDKVQKVPLLIVPPWINKYYILDLNQKNSMIKHLVDQGLSVFIVSWKNPTPDMADTSFENYLIDGVKLAIETVCDFCKVPQIHLTGYCIGGTLVSTYMAWANAHFGPTKTPVLDWTLFTTLTDFQRPGDISVFIDETIIEHLEESMAKKGYLDGGEMASSFRLLRSNSLVWNYWVHSYLYGENLAPIDVLFWNMDCTRMPHAMHAYYLREMYLHNNLVKPGHIKLAGETIDLGKIAQPLYAVTAQDDHIAPWQECYRIRDALNPATPVEFVLSTSGHILGIINPPTNPPKRSYWAGQPATHEPPEKWRARTEKIPGTWWDHWTNWLKAKAPEEIKAYPTSSKSYPALADAPGTYVMEK